MAKYVEDLLNIVNGLPTVREVKVNDLATYGVPAALSQNTPVAVSNIRLSGDGVLLIDIDTDTTP